MTRKHSDEAVRGCCLFLIFPPLGLLYFLIKILEKGDASDDTRSPADDRRRRESRSRRGA